MSAYQLLPGQHFEQRQQFGSIAQVVDKIVDAQWWYALQETDYISASMIQFTLI